MHEGCDIWHLTDETKGKLELVSEELYTNIFSYAYPENEGKIEVIIMKETGSLTLIFRDNGIPYNPLENPDPDVTLPPENRDIGGLGIYMVKSTVDEIDYEYKNECNILTMTIFI